MDWKQLGMAVKEAGPRPQERQANTTYNQSFQNRQRQVWGSYYNSPAWQQAKRDRTAAMNNAIAEHFRDPGMYGTALAAGIKAPIRTLAKVPSAAYSMVAQPISWMGHAGAYLGGKLGNLTPAQVQQQHALWSDFANKPVEWWNRKLDTTIPFGYYGREIEENPEFNKVMNFVEDMGAGSALGMGMNKARALQNSLAEKAWTRKMLDKISTPVGVTKNGYMRREDFPMNTLRIPYNGNTGRPDPSITSIKLKPDTAIRRKKAFVDSVNDFIGYDKHPMRRFMRTRVKTPAEAERYLKARFPDVASTESYINSLDDPVQQRLPISQWVIARDGQLENKMAALKKIQNPSVFGNTVSVYDAIAESGAGPNIYKGWKGSYPDIETAIQHSSMGAGDRVVNMDSPRWWSLLGEVPHTGGNYTGKGGTFAVMKLPEQMKQRILNASTNHAGKAMTLEEAANYIDKAPNWGARFPSLSSSPDYEVAIPWKEMQQLMQTSPYQKTYRVVSGSVPVSIPGRRWADPVPEELKNVLIREVQKGVPDGRFIYTPKTPVNRRIPLIPTAVGGGQKELLRNGHSSENLPQYD